MEKINVAELLKDCPKGMELDCTKYSNVCFVGIDNDKKEPKIKLKIETSGTWCSELTLDKYGKESSHPNAKCLIFPKGKTTWEGFQRPFKDGDILSYQYEDFTNRTIYIYMQHSRMNTTYYVALSGNFDSKFMINDKEGYALNGYNDSVRLATEEEKEKLFQAIKDNGYRWNAETKTLEKLVEPKFKVGDKIRSKNKKDECFYILDVDKDRNKYILNIKGYCLEFKDQNNYELVLDKFDVSTLKPFDKVLVRCSSLEKWHIQFFEKYNTELGAKYPFICLCNSKYCQCIPYEGNEHLLGTTNNCDEYYKNW